jgi:hypothetical protein
MGDVLRCIDEKSLDREGCVPCLTGCLSFSRTPGEVALAVDNSAERIVRIAEQNVRRTE